MFHRGFGRRGYMPPPPPPRRGCGCLGCCTVLTVAVFVILVLAFIITRL